MCSWRSTELLFLLIILCLDFYLCLFLCYLLFLFWYLLLSLLIILCFNLLLESSEIMIIYLSISLFFIFFFSTISLFSFIYCLVYLYVLTSIWNFLSGNSVYVQGIIFIYSNISLKLDNNYFLLSSKYCISLFLSFLSLSLSLDKLVLIILAIFFVELFNCTTTNY